jgi:hypothetical protein
VLIAGAAWDARELGAAELKGLAPGRALWILTLPGD